MLKKLRQELRTHANPERAQISLRFFKTGKGQYGEGDQFIGLSVPEQRRIAKRYHDLTLTDIELLLLSPIHEERLIALIILVHQFQHGDEKQQRMIVDFYLAHTNRINNWDLVDSSAQYILGAFLFGKTDKIRKKLAHSSSLWERRIAIISTFYDLYQGSCDKTVEIASMLLQDKHDLIHKAVGWMLREMGKRCSQDALKAFLNEHKFEMPRTMLRYAIERLPKQEQQEYLKRSSQKN